MRNKGATQQRPRRGDGCLTGLTAACCPPDEDKYIRVLDDDTQQVAERKWPSGVIDPTSTRKVRWDAVIMFLILYSAVTVPVRLAFSADAHTYIWDFEAAMSVMFIMDVVISFNTAYFDGGYWITDHEKIVHKYSRGWFCVDAPSSVPVELIEAYMLSESSTSTSLAAFRLLRLFRLIRLARLLKIKQFITHIEEHFDVNLRPMRVVQLSVTMLFTAHLVACLWFYIATLAPDGEPNWIDSYDESRASDGKPHDLKHWYVEALYWTLATLTTVGYGDVIPVNDFEREFTIAIMLFGALIFAYIVGEVGSMLQTMDRQSSLVEERMDAVREYLAWRGIPRDTAIRVRRYYEHYYTKRAVFDERSILDNLNPTLHQEVVEYILASTTSQNPVFSKLSASFKLMLFPLLKPQALGHGEVLFEKGAASCDMGFLLDGEITILSEIDNLTPARTLRPNEEIILPVGDCGEDPVVVEGSGCFGQSVLVGKRRQETHVASQESNIVIISKADLEKIFMADPLSARRLSNVVLKDFFKMERLRSLANALRLSSLPKGERRSAMLIQHAWHRYADKQAQEHDELYKTVVRKKEAITKKERAQSKSVSRTMTRRATLAASSFATAIGAATTATAGAESDDSVSNVNVQLSLAEINRKTDDLDEIKQNVQNIEQRLQSFEQVMEAVVQRSMQVEHKLEAILLEVQFEREVTPRNTPRTTGSLASSQEGMVLDDSGGTALEAKLYRA